MNPSRLFSISVVCLFGLIVLLPIVYMLSAPFWATSGGSTGGSFSLFESRHLGLAQNSLGIGGGTVLLSLLAGVPLAFLISRTELRGSSVFGILFIIPVLIPPYIHAIVWTHLGPFIERSVSLDIHSLWGVIFILTLAYFPFVTLMTLAGLKSIDRNLEEVSLICHGRLRTVRRITLPLVLPHIISGAVFVFVFSLINVGVPDILRVKVYPLEIFIQFSAFYDEGAATIMTLPLIGVTFVFIALQKWYMKDRSYVQISSGMSRHVTYGLGILHTPAFFYCLVLMGLSVGVPIAVLIKVAGAFENYVRVLSTSLDQVGYSLILAFFGAVSTILLGLCLAYLVERLQGKTNAFLSWAVFIPLGIPATALGVGLIGIWNRPMADLVYGSSLIIVLGYVARFIPYAVIVLQSALKQVSVHLEEAAFLAGSTGTNIFRRIVVPLSRQSLSAVLFLVFVLAFGELGTTLLVIPPGRETIPVKAYNLMHYGADQMVAALCLILVLLILTISGIFLVFHNRLIRQPS
jgi:iron(III) transport system permease protein